MDYKEPTEQDKRNSREAADLARRINGMRKENATRNKKDN